MKKSSIYTFLSLAVLLAGFSSCLKENAMTVMDADKGNPVITFINTGNNAAATKSKYPRYVTDLGQVANGESVSFNLNVGLNGPDVASEDITVSVAVDPDILTLYNTQNGSSFEAPPAEIYSFPSTIVIKKGERIAQAVVEITNNSSFDFNANYGLPLKIASVSSGTTISDNFGKAVYSFSARNSYDGIYLMEATAPMVDVLSPAISGWYPIEMQLITYTGNSIALYDGINYTNAYGHPIKSGSSGSYYGDFSPVFFFDETGKITSITNYSGQEAGGNKRSALLDPTGVNQATFNADGSVKSFEVSYIMAQSVTTPFAPRTFFHEKFTYEEPR